MDEITFKEAAMRKLKAEKEGGVAFREGVEENPYPSDMGSGAMSGLRIAWWTGWYDAKVFKKLGHIFKKYNMTWPPTKNEMAQWRAKNTIREAKSKDD